MDLVTCAVYSKSRQNEQNLEIIQGELQLELFQDQAPPAAWRTFASGGHPQTSRNRGNADKETRLPGEEDRARNNDSEEAWDQKQEGYVFVLVKKKSQLHLEKRLIGLLRLFTVA